MTRSRPAALPEVSLGDIRQDLRYALRTLAKQRVFAAAAILMLALGIGANSAMFALADAILLQPLAFREPDRLVKVWERTPESERGAVSPRNLADWNERAMTFERIAAYVPNVGGMVLANTDGTSETIPRQWVSSGIFDVLGVTPIAGRTFQPSDDTDRANVVILSESFWRSRFNADPAAVGRPIRLDGDTFTIVGVVPDSAQVIGRTGMWALGINAFVPNPPPAVRGLYFSHAIGRLKPGVSLDAAADDLATVAAGLARDYPATNTGRGVTVEPLTDAVFGRELRLTSLLFIGIVGLVLLICCANIANLLLTRATARRRELAVRAALGADRARVVRQLLVESLTLAVLGGVLAAAVGAAILEYAPSIVPPDLMPATLTLSFDLRLLGFCAVTTLFVGILFGLAPARLAARLPLAQVIAADTRMSSARGGRTRAMLAVAQVAMAVVLLFSAGLLLHTLMKLNAVDRGYRAHSVLSMIVDPVDSRYDGSAGLLRFYDAIEREVRAARGIRSVGWATTLPMGRSYMGDYGFRIVGDPPPPAAEGPSADFQIVSPSYFETVDLPIVAGRAFDERDRAGTQMVCLVNEAFVRRYFDGRSPLGARLAFRPASREAPPVIREIVGVVKQVKSRPDEPEPFLQLYAPLAQNTPGDIFLLVRPDTGDAGALARPVLAAIGRVDTEQLTSVREVQTLEDILAVATARHRFRAVLVMTFAGLALVLAMVGVFGVLAYSVEQRLRDFAVRRALGATTLVVLRVVGGSAVRLVASGVAIGLAVSIAIGRLLATLLFEVQPLDTATLAAVVGVLTLTAIVSMLLPAVRAARVSPVTALRAE